MIGHVAMHGVARIAEGGHVQGAVDQDPPGDQHHHQGECGTSNGGLDGEGHDTDLGSPHPAPHQRKGGQKEDGGETGSNGRLGESHIHCIHHGEEGCGSEGKDGQECDRGEEIGLAKDGQGRHCQKSKKGEVDDEIHVRTHPPRSLPSPVRGCGPSPAIPVLRPSRAPHRSSGRPGPGRTWKWAGEPDEHKHQDQFEGDQAQPRLEDQAPEDHPSPHGVYDAVSVESGEHIRHSQKP
jgi:hypothetical protein